MLFFFQWKQTSALYENSCILGARFKKKKKKKTVLKIQLLWITGIFFLISNCMTSYERNVLKNHEKQPSLKSLKEKMFDKKLVLSND